QLNGIAQYSAGVLSAMPHNGLNNVYSLAVSGNILYAGGGVPGTFDSAITSQAIIQYSGGAWAAMPHNGLSGLGVWSMAVSGNTLYVGGLFQKTADLA